MTRAEAAPIAPASCVSTKCTSSASAGELCVEAVDAARARA